MQTDLFTDFSAPSHFKTSLYIHKKLFYLAPADSICQYAVSINSHCRVLELQKLSGRSCQANQTQCNNGSLAVILVDLSVLWHNQLRSLLLCFYPRTDRILTATTLLYRLTSWKFIKQLTWLDTNDAHNKLKTTVFALNNKNTIVRRLNRWWE